ncbi:MAG TPA: nuclear transport factor 2 family protein [Solirubrobacterales bacterium]|nr:nuclear transport factor 2 family protein [Solirubrobacterales bacterium]
MKTETLVAAPPQRIACLALPKLIGSGNLDAATRCFARDACLLTPDATAIHDREHIRPLLAQLISRRVRIEVEQSNVLVAGDVAYVRELWQVSARVAAGSQYEHSCDPSLVLKRIEDSWKISIATLWGWGGR